MGTTQHVFWFDEIGKEANVMVGKKCANLGEMTRLKMPVPAGFAISVTAHERFLEETGARQEINKLLDEGGDLKDYKVSGDISERIRQIVESKEMPLDLSRAITSHYKDLCSRRDCEVAVSVRSAGIISHPGMYETYLNIKGADQVVQMVKRVWASIFNHRTICAAVQHDLPVSGSPCIGVGVVELVNARCAGVCFTIDPVTGNPGRAVIESNWGLGEGVVSGQIDVDRYFVDKESLNVVDRILGEKKIRIVPRGFGIVEEECPHEMQGAFSLRDEEAAEVVKIGKTLEAHFDTPQDLEWTIDADRPFPNNIWLLQTRGVVGVKVQEEKSAKEKMKEELAKRFKRMV